MPPVRSIARSTVLVSTLVAAAIVSPVSPRAQERTTCRCPSGWNGRSAT